MPRPSDFFLFLRYAVNHLVSLIVAILIIDHSSFFMDRKCLCKSLFRQKKKKERETETITLSIWDIRPLIRELLTKKLEELEEERKEDEVT